MRMNQIGKLLLADECGFVLSSEAVLVGTVGVLGATVGLAAISESVNDELTELAFAVRSLDQSYSFKGQKSCCAWTAGSEYIQPDVDDSLEDLCGDIEEMERDDDDRDAEEKKSRDRDRDGDREELRRDDSSERKEREELKRKDEERETDRKQRDEDRRRREDTSPSA